MLLQTGDLLKHAFQAAGLFPGSNQIAVQRIEIPRMPTQRIRQIAARADIGFQRTQQADQHRVAAALGNHLKRLQQRDTGTDQTGQLAAELAQLAATQRALPAPQPGLYPLDTERANTAFTQLGAQQGRAAPTALATDQRPLRRSALPAVAIGFFGHRDILVAWPAQTRKQLQGPCSEQECPLLTRVVEPASANDRRRVTKGVHSGLLARLLVARC
ncbi:hypothetical protein D3C81_1315720 [compost metagenome]